MSRRGGVAVVIGSLAAMAVVGFVAGSRVRSPAEEAARTAPPDPSPILVPVEERVMTTRVVTRGTGRFGSPQKLSVAASALKPSAGLVAAPPVSGVDLAEGDVLVAASGRPIFVLVGARPMSRDLGPGATGDDVLQLEDALARLGFDPGLRDGNYDGATAGAVARWYTAEGYAPFTATAEQEAALRSRESELATASVEAVTAQDALAAAAAAQVSADAALVAASSHATATARVVERARTEAAAANHAAAAEVAARQTALDALVDGGQATPGELSVAEADVRSARATSETVRLAGERAVDEAFLAATDSAATLPSHQAALEAARTARANAERSVALRESAAQIATRERDLARSRTGVQVPADEIVFVASMPVRVAESIVGSGDPAVGGIARVTDAVVHVEAGLAVGDSNLVEAGMTARIEEPDLGIATDGAVVRVADSPGTNGVDGFHVYVEVAVSDPPANLVGASVRLTIPVQTSERPVLAVPLSAVTLAPDGTSRVQRALDSGRHPATEFVAVEPGLAADGFAQVTSPTGSLRAGDLVVVGVGATSTPVASRG